MTASSHSSDATVKQIAELLLPTTRSQVEKAYRDWNRLLRDQLTEETRLQLTIRGQARVPIHVQDGMPKPLADIVGQIDFVLLRLALGQSTIRAMTRGTEYLSGLWPVLDTWAKLPEELHGQQPAIDATREIGQRLLDLIASLRLQQKIAMIRQDLLGSYDPVAQSIELYWVPIGLLAGVMGCRVEDLTAVTLTHELAHAFTHLGQDAEKNAWDTNAFCKADLRITEGLAQYYTHIIASSAAADRRTAGFRVAYELLREHQSSEYQVHMKWAPTDVDLPKYGERVRLAMLTCRNRGITQYAEFRRLLTDARKRLKRQAAERISEVATMVMDLS